MEKISRREFLGTAAAAGSVLLAGGFAARPLTAAVDAGWPKLPPIKIHLVYVGTGGAWPTPTFDAPAEVAMFRKYLAGVEAKLGNENFVNKAKPEVVAQAMARLGELTEQLETVEKHLSELSV